ncbi:MAG: glycosyltransferase [Terriglobia bacterium]
MDNPVLSVVVAIASDTTSPINTRHLSPCLAALAKQAASPAMEIIVPVPAGVPGIAALRKQFPDVLILEFSDLRKYTGRGNSREHHGALIARGFAQARGSLIALIEDHDIVAPDWGLRAVSAHAGPFAGIGGAIENGIDRPLNWAVYISDFQLYQNPVPKGQTHRASDANVIYKRAALDRIRHVWEQEFHEASVNEAMESCGEKIAMAPDVVVFQHRQALRLRAALLERFVWGRSFGAWRCAVIGPAQRLTWIVFSPAIPLLLLSRKCVVAVRKRSNLGAFFKALPIITVLTVSWVCGELTGYITRHALPRRARTAGTTTDSSQGLL